MTWSTHFDSPVGDAISDFDALPATIGDKELYARDIDVALDAADSLSPSSEVGHQKVSLQGWRAKTPTGSSASFSVVVTQVVDE